MANDYFNHVNNRISPNTRALDSQINAIADEIVQGFDRLPTEQELKGGKGNQVTNTGTGSALAGDLSFVPSLADGFRVAVRTAVANTAGATFNLNSTGAKAIVNSDLSSITASNIAAGSIADLVYDATGDRWILQSNHAAWGKPEGTANTSPTEYFPGYTFTFVSTTTWRVAGIDVTSLFGIGRRLRFIEGANDYFGTITSRTFAGGNTDIVMSMEGGDVLTAGITEVGLVTGATAWSAVAGDPFGGESINAIATGMIGATSWWVAVGNSGKIATSTNAGVSWTIRSSSTAENFVAVAYNPDNQTFLASAKNGVFRRTSNGSTWTDPGGITVSGTGTGTPWLEYDEELNKWWVGIDDTTTVYRAYSAPDGATLTWTLRETGISANGRGVGYGLVGATETMFFAATGSAYTVDNADDAAIGIAFSITGSIFFSSLIEDAGSAYVCTCGSLGMYVHTVGGAQQTFDDLNFTAPMRRWAYSPLHDRIVAVGESANLGYNDPNTARTVSDSWTFVASGFNPLANILDVAWSASDGIFIAVADNGQICRSSNGTN